MKREKLKVGLIYGSARDRRLCDTVATWAAGQLWMHGAFALDVIDPRDYPMASNGSGVVMDKASELRAKIDQADAFVVVTPEYNHGYPAALKGLIDSARAEWQTKPVAFVSYGGLSGGIRAVEQLRLVFAELHTVTLRDSVSFANAWDQFDEHGEPVDAEVAAQAAGRMLERLQWWAVTLREGRRAIPYEGALAA